MTLKSSNVVVDVVVVVFVVVVVVVEVVGMVHGAPEMARLRPYSEIIGNSRISSHDFFIQKRVLPF